MASRIRQAVKWNVSGAGIVNSKCGRFSIYPAVPGRNKGYYMYDGVRDHRGWFKLHSGAKHSAECRINDSICRGSDPRRMPKSGSERDVALSERELIDAKRCGASAREIRRIEGELGKHMANAGAVSRMRKDEVSRANARGSVRIQDRK